ncbi:MAG: peptide chain release factor N(5)-glutamine methyltransferase [Lachnospiraceae bacterium]|nr:peptide chain release factor N(5)-glutamine methyltransferase [Lachnospiraceae bacterium]
MTVRDFLALAGERLDHAGIEDPRFEALLILEEAAGTGRAAALAHPEEELDAGQAARCEELLGRREQGEPMAYLTGRQEFMGLEFHVGPAVLIPRADTETLAEEALRHLHDGMRILDLCTGSGAVALSLLHYSNDTTAMATDIDAAALAAAGENAAALGLAERVRFSETDLFPPEAEREAYDLITANPPYIPTGEIGSLMRDVRDHEPRIALDGGADGLAFYRRITAQAPAWLHNDGWLLVEIGYDQGESVRRMFEEAGFHAVEVVQDLGGHDRVVKGCYY